jgi:[ribosomal protein S18]-alanine N-acetyltransferase
MTGLRPVGLADGELLATLHGECFPDDPWNAAAMCQVLAMPGAFGMIALDEAGEEPRGFLLAQAIAGQCEILGLGVRESARRSGIGRSLLDRLLAEAAAARQTVFLEVAEDNLPARALYAAAGLVVVGRRPGYYRRRDGSLVAALQLRDARAEA